MRLPPLTILLAAPLLCCYTIAMAETRDDRTAIENVVRDQTDAWNRGDAEAFAANYAEDGSFTNVIGMQLYGRKAFIEQHASIFRTIYQGSHLTTSIVKIKFVRPDIAVVDIDGALEGAKELPPGLKAGSDGALHVKLLEVMSKQGGKWVIDAFHNVAVYPIPPRN